MSLKKVLGSALLVLVTASILTPGLSGDTAPAGLSADDPSPPSSTVKLVFVHHSVGDELLDVSYGNLGNQLGANNYFVSDTYYDWGPDEIGSSTDIGDWWTWFRGPKSATYLQALYGTENQHAPFTRPMADPGGDNEVILFKSCYPNSDLKGAPGEPPTTGNNPLKEEGATSEHHTVGNAKGIYNDILVYFATRQDKLFVAITAPPLVENDADHPTNATHAANARAFNDWLVHDWLATYPHDNVAVFDFFNVLTSNGGSTSTNDYGWTGGNHHRWWNSGIQHITNVNSDFCAYGTTSRDSHPTGAGTSKAAREFMPLLNIYYNRWSDGEPEPTITRSATATRTTTRPPTSTPRPTTSRTPTTWLTPTATRTTTAPLWVGLPLILKPKRVIATPTPTRTQTRTPAPSPSPSAEPTAGSCPSYPAGYRPVTGTAVHQMPVLTEPSPRQWFTEPAFGSCMARVTDRDNDLTPGDPSTGMVNEYSRVQAYNSDETRMIMRGTDGTWYLYNAETLQPIRQLPLEQEPRWDASDPDTVYYSDETKLMSYDVGTGVASEVRDFAGDLPTHTLVAVWTRDEGRPSNDTRFWARMAQNTVWDTVGFMVYDLQEDVVAVRDVSGLAGVTDGIDHVTMSSLGTYLLASFDRYCERGSLGTDSAPCGLMVYDRDLENSRGLLRTIGHYDTALDAAGREVIVFQDNDTDNISMLDLVSGQVTTLWEIDFSHTAIGFHFSGCAEDRPGWAVVSTLDDDAAVHTWMDDQVFLVELKAGGRVVRLAHTHSIVDENEPLEHYYWAEPHATVNRDLTRVLFSTNWGRYDTGQVECYAIALPQDWPSRLQ